MNRSCGIDWAEGHHDVAIVDGDGKLVAKKRISDDLTGFSALSDLLADSGDGPENPIPVAIETPRGLLVAALRAGVGLAGAQPHPGDHRGTAGCADRGRQRREAFAQDLFSGDLGVSVGGALLGVTVNRA